MIFCFGKKPPGYDKMLLVKISHEVNQKLVLCHPCTVSSISRDKSLLEQN